MAVCHLFMCVFPPALPADHQEGLQILHYEHGQKYEPHFDYFHDAVNASPERGGQRVATLLMYLSTPEEGGETVFPNAASKEKVAGGEWSECAKQGLAVKTYKGDALLFYRWEGGRKQAAFTVLQCTSPASAHMVPHGLGSRGVVPHGWRSNNPAAQPVLSFPPSPHSCGPIFCLFCPPLSYTHSLKPDGSNDPSSLHSSCPTTKGNKWSATKWVGSICIGYLGAGVWVEINHTYVPERMSDRTVSFRPLLHCWI